MKIEKENLNELFIIEDKKSFSMKSDLKVIKLMSDTLYKNKQQSVFREIYSNCQDAQLMNKNKKPIDLSFYFNYNEDKFESFDIGFRDYGPGIDPNKIVDIYCTFFGSSKSETNSQIGGFGLGCKSPISICNSYLVHNYYNGKVYKYLIEYDETLTISLISEEETNEDNGIFVKIRFYDVNKNNKEPAYLYKELLYSYIPRMLVSSLFKTNIKVFIDGNFINSGIFVPNRIKLKDNYYISNSLMYFNILSDSFGMLFKENASINYEEIRSTPQTNREILLLNGSIPFDYHEIRNDISLSKDINKEQLIANTENMYNTLYGILNKPELHFNFEDGIIEQKMYDRPEYIYEIIQFPVGTIDISTSREYAMNTPENVSIITKSIEEADKFLSSIKIDKRSIDLNYFNNIKKPFINTETSKIDLSLIGEEDKIKIKIRTYRKDVNRHDSSNIIIVNKKYDKSHLLKFNSNVIWAEENMHKYLFNPLSLYNDNININRLINIYLSIDNDQKILNEFINLYSDVLKVNKNAKSNINLSKNILEDSKDDLEILFG